MKEINLAIVGATGLVGSNFIKVLNEHNELKINKIYFYASQKSAGKTILFRGKPNKVIKLSKENIVGKQIDYVLFSAGGSVAKEYANLFVNMGAIVIDNSSAFRMEKNVPLIVPEVNFQEIKNSKLISNPNCSTIQCMLPLKILNDNFGINKVSYTTFQAVSGSGVKGINDLEITSNGESPAFYNYPIFNNCLPHIDSFLDNGFTKEEIKMVNETRKILNLPDLKISATCVRVPVFNSHSIDVLVELKENYDLEKIKSLFKGVKGLVLIDDIKNNKYPIATMASGQDNILIGRIRKDLLGEKFLRFWCVADNIRKGAATNAVQILLKMLNS